MTLPAKAEQAIAQLAAESPQAYSRWSDATFRAYVAGPLAVLVEQLRAKEDAAEMESVSLAYLQMLREGIGTGLVGPIERNCANLLEYSLRESIPRQLAAVPKQDRLKVLARVWNLCEGLSHEPAWLNQYVLNRAAAGFEIERIETFLSAVLSPVLSAGSKATWTGPFRISVLNPRPWEDDFLPGEMHLMAHAIACVNDRRGKTCLGVLFQKGGKSEFIGPLPSSRQHVEPQPADWRVEPNRLCIPGHQVALPYLARPHRTLFAAAGFAVVSAVDSQRLWIVESQS